MCLDEAIAVQLKRETEANPRITLAHFLKFMENDFGKDFSAQSRDEWRAVKLTNWGKCLKAKELRTFQQQFETAADRVLDKGEREAYDLLFDQLSGYWQEKVVKEERTQGGQQILGSFWYRSWLEKVRAHGNFGECRCKV